jgi:hypothetical protein
MALDMGFEPKRTAGGVQITDDVRKYIDAAWDRANDDTSDAPAPVVKGPKVDLDSFQAQAKAYCATRGLKFRKLPSKNDPDTVLRFQLKSATDAD